jgi:hypothetical protein
MYQWNSGKVLEDVTDLHRQRILVFTLSRMVWQLKEMQSASASYGRYQGTFLDQEMSDTISILDKFIPINPISQAEGKIQAIPKQTLNLATQCLQAIHMVHLHTIPGLLDSMYQLLKDKASDLHDSSISHIRRLPKVRRAAFHCAQILALSRGWPSGSSSEPFNVFHAGLALWMVSPLLKQRYSIRDQEWTVIQRLLPGATTTTEQLDSADVTRRLDTPAMTESHSDWLQLRLDEDYALDPLPSNNGNSVLSQWLSIDEDRLGTTEEMSNVLDTPIIVPSIHGVTDLTTPAGRHQVLFQTADMLKNMPAWSIAGKLRGLVIGLLARQKDSFAARPDVL